MLRKKGYIYSKKYHYNCLIIIRSLKEIPVINVYQYTAKAKIEKIAPIDNT